MFYRVLIFPRIFRQAMLITEIVGTRTSVRFTRVSLLSGLILRKMYWEGGGGGGGWAGPKRWTSVTMMCVLKWPSSWLIYIYSIELCQCLFIQDKCFGNKTSIVAPVLALFLKAFFCLGRTVKIGLCQWKLSKTSPYWQWNTISLPKRKLFCKPSSEPKEKFTDFEIEFIIIYYFPDLGKKIFYLFLPEEFCTCHCLPSSGSRVLQTVSDLLFKNPNEYRHVISLLTLAQLVHVCVMMYPSYSVHDGLGHPSQIILELKLFHHQANNVKVGIRFYVSSIFNWSVHSIRH